MYHHIHAAHAIWPYCHLKNIWIPCEALLKTKSKPSNCPWTVSQKVSSAQNISLPAVSWSFLFPVLLLRVGGVCIAVGRLHLMDERRKQMLGVGDGKTTKRGGFIITKSYEPYVVILYETKLLERLV